MPSEESAQQDIHSHVDLITLQIDVRSVGENYSLMMRSKTDIAEIIMTIFHADTELVVEGPVAASADGPAAGNLFGVPDGAAALFRGRAKEIRQPEFGLA